MPVAPSHPSSRCSGTASASGATSHRPPKKGVHLQELRSQTCTPCRREPAPRRRPSGPWARRRGQALAPPRCGWREGGAAMRERETHVNLYCALPRLCAARWSRENMTGAKRETEQAAKLTRPFSICLAPPACVLVVEASARGPAGPARQQLQPVAPSQKNGTRLWICWLRGALSTQQCALRRFAVLSRAPLANLSSLSLLPRSRPR